MTMRRRSLLAAGVAALAGCGLVPEESDPIEASAARPAVLPAAVADEAGYELAVETTTTVETTVTADVSGDVELSARRDVVMTLFRRGYRTGDGARRFGLVTAPAVRLIGNAETRYDPVPALADSRVVELATGRAVDAVGDWSEAGTVTLLGSEVSRETARAGDAALVKASARAGDDAVTAVGVAPTADALLAPFDAVEYGE
jgi:hypothetical protein